MRSINVANHLENIVSCLSHVKIEVGFTLFELLMVIAITGIVGCLAIPRMGNQVATAQVLSTARGVMAFMDDAKSLARTRNEILWIEMNSDNSTTAMPWSLRLRTASDSAASSTILQQFPGHSSVVVELGYLNDVIVIDGLKSKISTGSLKLSSKPLGVPRVKVITSYAAGRIRLCTEEERLDGLPLC
jgi:type IV fimbrial biogenesis protein FimT